MSLHYEIKSFIVYRRIFLKYIFQCLCPINSNDVFLGRKRGLHNLIFNRTIAENNINIHVINKESFFDYCEKIK